MPTDIELRLLKDFQIVLNDTRSRNRTRSRRTPARRTPRSCWNLGLRQGEYRNLLDRLLQQASGGQLKLGKEPDNKDQLPEEADKARSTRMNS